MWVMRLSPPIIVMGSFVQCTALRLWLPSRWTPRRGGFGPCAGWRALAVGFGALHRTAWSETACFSSQGFGLFVHLLWLSGPFKARFPLVALEAACNSFF